jgi:hypothetical protein
MNSAVEWLVEQFDLEMQDDFHLTKIEQAKEMEKQKQEEFAIGFAEWLRENYYDNGELWTEWNSDDNTHSSKELLEIYKKEKTL